MSKEHETRAREAWQRYSINAYVKQDPRDEQRFIEIFTEAHAAGFEAGLRARMPSFKEVHNKLVKDEPEQRSEYGEGFAMGVGECFHWLTANMRNEGV